MKDNRALCCFFPTTTLFVDDNRVFLDGLKYAFNKALGPYQTFDSPEALIEHCKSLPQTPDFVSRCVTHPEEEIIAHRTIDVNIPSLFQEVYNPERFNIPSVVVTDFEMPTVNGEELCKELANLPIKKLMLTGEADENKAVELFNEGIIDKFIRKDADDFADKLNDAVRELQESFFQTLSNIITSSIVDNPDYLPSCLSEPKFVNLFNETCKQHKASEFYLTDASGTFLLLDTEGKPTWLIVKDEEDMNSFYDLASSAEKAVAPELVSNLQNKSQLVHAQTEDQMMLEPHQWQPLAHPSTCLEGLRAKYYYSVVTGSDSYDIEPGKICSYSEFLKKGSK